MKIEITKSIGRAGCILCHKTINEGKMQIRVTDYHGFTKNIHLQCIMAKAIKEFPFATVQEMEEVASEAKYVLNKRSKKYGD